MSESEEYHKRLLDRVGMFNDGVYAIVLTLLVLELHIPELANKSSLTEFIGSLEHMAPKFSAFLLSVLLVGGNWISSVNLQRVVVKSNELCIVLSVTYLIIVSIFPFVCAVIGNYPTNPGSYLIFGIPSILLAINAYCWMYSINKHKMLHAHSDYKEWRKLMKLILFVIPFLILVSLSSFISTKLSFSLFLLTNLFPFFLTRSIRINHKE